MIARRPRWTWFLVAVALAGTVVVGVPALRAPVLRAAGWALVVDEPMEPADIVVAADADGAGLLEAADLVHRGIAKRVAVFADPPITRWIGSSSVVEFRTKTRPHGQHDNCSRLA